MSELTLRERARKDKSVARIKWWSGRQYSYLSELLKTDEAQRVLRGESIFAAERGPATMSEDWITKARAFLEGDESVVRNKNQQHRPKGETE